MTDSTDWPWSAPLPVQYTDPGRGLPRCAVSLFPITTNRVCPRHPGRVYACEACRVACGTCPTSPSPPPPPASTGFPRCGAHCVNGCGFGNVDDATMECYLDDNPDVDCLVNHELNGARCHWGSYGRTENRPLGCSSEAFSASPTGGISTSPTPSPSSISTASSTQTQGTSSYGGIRTTAAAVASTLAPGPVAPTIPSTAQVTLDIATLPPGDQGGSSSDRIHDDDDDDSGGPVPLPAVVGVGVCVCVLALVICAARRLSHRRRRPTGTSVLAAVPPESKGSGGWSKDCEDSWTILWSLHSTLRAPLLSCAWPFDESYRWR